jgi:hypothetical protein
MAADKLKGLPDFDSTMRRFESSRPSQAVRRLETLPSAMPKSPANGGLSRFRGRSLGSRFGELRGETTESLRPYPVIFPFFGRPALETRFDLHCVADAAVQLVVY